MKLLCALMFLCAIAMIALREWFGMAFFFVLAGLAALGALTEKDDQ